MIRGESSTFLIPPSHIPPLYRAGLAIPLLAFKFRKHPSLHNHHSKKPVRDPFLLSSSRLLGLHLLEKNTPVMAGPEAIDVHHCNEISNRKYGTVHLYNVFPLQ
ncbi:hypothetical protein CY34DRAFT_753764 [Suillus luteus UH-Slu-Lm8-n1]|uniref:Uncharacterized protein n=1 Tax=Suillus luteus UH-Slu-Lm8-n1 TaxID=930992 RepID=A0A0C9ZYC2_9AGAM|nr:hypothetical protein CY34DRAFT_753764 [Suillus luteus UH-Slu-Lm8-n1]